MDSRIIYESDKTLSPKVKWIRADNSESEWHYFDPERPEIIHNLINNFFTTDTVHASIGRRDSYNEKNKRILFHKVKPLIGESDFKIWDEGFTKVIEVNKIDVYRTGIISYFTAS
jgi:hypothetical protein